MYKNKSEWGNNLCGKNVALIRKKRVPRTSQRALAEMLQLQGVDLDKNAIQRIESGERFVTDIELVALAKVLDVKMEELVKNV
ncbi:MAG: helix-turn-helix transcriptional regulator [Oscillospiraceae bacterium]|nr:helix-turn-helix transcriptional regulator [Oscillospiraceae bacterium]